MISSITTYMVIFVQFLPDDFSTVNAYEDYVWFLIFFKVHFFPKSLASLKILLLNSVFQQWLTKWNRKLIEKGLSLFTFRIVFGLKIKCREAFLDMRHNQQSENGLERYVRAAMTEYCMHHPKAAWERISLPERSRRKKYCRFAPIILFPKKAIARIFTPKVTIIVIWSWIWCVIR